VKVKKENDRFFHELSFLKCPSYEELLEEIYKVLEIKKDQIKYIAKDDTKVREKNMETLSDGQKLVVYLK